jgi:hypothetical protein
VGELPSLKEFEELAKQALGSEWAAETGPQPPATAEASAPPASEPTPQDEAVAEEFVSEVSPSTLPESEDQG